MLMNVFDEQYQTVEGYLMTPRTLVYGLSWKIFN
jgi:outer membrane cobalamin receptor